MRGPATALLGLAMTLVVASLAYAQTPARVKAVVIGKWGVKTSTIDFEEQSLQIYDKQVPCDTKGAASGEPIGFHLTTDGHTYRASMPHACDPALANAKDFSSGSGWRLLASPNHELVWPDFAGWWFDPCCGGYEGRVQTFSWTLYEGGAKLDSGRFAVTWRETGGPRKIWEGTDDFINICIDKTQHIRSEGGRLYCYYGTKVEESLVKILK